MMIYFKSYKSCLLNQAMASQGQEFRFEILEEYSDLT